MGREQELKDARNRLEVLWDSIIVMEKTVTRQIAGLKNIVQALFEDVDAMEKDDE